MGVDVDVERAREAPDADRLDDRQPAEAGLADVGRTLALLRTSAAAAAAPHGGGGTTGSSERLLGNVQRLAGNTAASAVGELLAARSSTGIQRDPDDDSEAAPQTNVSVTGLSLSADTVTLPLTGTLSASVEPANATGVTYSIAAGTADVANVAIDASSGVITISTGQQGGTIEVSADGADGSGATVDLTIIERPGAISATETAGTENYGGEFTHTFTAPSGRAAGLEGANINEEFASTTATTPWGIDFELTANAADSHGWDLDSDGKMAGPDNVTIESAGVDLAPFVDSTSNPADNPPALPQGFTMTQRLFAKKQPGGQREATPFTTVAHRRELIAGGQFRVSAGQGSIPEPYSGPAVVSNARSSPASVQASEPRPDSGEWDQETVTVDADPIPDTAALSFSIEGPDLGCSVDADGEVSIGSTPGTITVRVSATAANYDEVTITITSRPAAGGSSTTPDADADAPTAAPPPDPDAPG